MESIEEILKRYDEKEAQEQLARARARSVRAERRERRTRQEKADFQVIKDKLLTVILIGTLLVGGVVIVKGGIDMTANRPLKMENLSGEIGALVNTNKDPRYSSMSILAQNTERTQDGFYYKHEDIAKDLLSLDDSLFDYAFCTICDGMGNNIKNKVGVGGRSNIDAVIYYLKTISGDKSGELSSDYVAREFEGVDELDDYLIKHGYVDKEGKPSIALFKEACDNNAQVIRDIIEGKASMKGTHI